MHLYLLILYTYHLITIKPIRNMYLYIKFIQDLKEKRGPKLDCISFQASQASLLCTDGRSVLLEAGQHGVRRLRLHGVHHLGFCKKVKH